MGFIQCLAAGKESKCRFSVADFYLYVTLTWVEKFGLKLDRKQNIDRFFNQLSERPSFKEAKSAETA